MIELNRFLIYHGPALMLALCAIAIAAVPVGWAVWVTVRVKGGGE